LAHGPVRVPSEADLGNAKVTFSFDAWPEGRVSPSTIELPVSPPKENASDGE
jgi:hypothetical protein